MLEELFKEHKRWLTMSYSICNNEERAEDYVQEMYIKISEIDLTPGNTSYYVYKTIKSIIIDEARKNKEFVCAPHIWESSTDTDEAGFSFADTLIDRIEVDYEEVNREAVIISIIKELYQELPEYKQKVLRYSFIYGLREFSRTSEISKTAVQNVRLNFKKSVWTRHKQMSPEELEKLLQKTMKQVQSLAKSADEIRIF